jgi:hypothetical protein
VDRQPDVLSLIGGLLERAPPDSVFVIEADAKFEMNLLPATIEWDVRPYLPAVVAIGRKPA